MIYTGVDWSGDPGNPARRPGASPVLAFAAATILDSDLSRLSERLTTVRQDRKLAPTYAFKHVTAASGVRQAFFDGNQGLPLAVHALVIDKRMWDRAYVEATDGLARIIDGLALLVKCCPDESIAGQTLLIDMDRGAAKEMRRIRAEMRKTLRAFERHPFGNVRACPDHRDLGDIIQIADMVAGECREHGALAGAHLSRLGSKLTLCH